MDEGMGDKEHQNEITRKSHDWHKNGSGPIWQPEDLTLSAAQEIARLLTVIDCYCHSSAASCREINHMRAQITELKLQLNRADALNAELADRNIHLSIELAKQQRKAYLPEFSN